MTIAALETRRAEPCDAAAIAEAHVDSIRSIGPTFYPPAVVDDWRAGITPDLYLNAMKRGEIFFIARGSIDGTRAVLGFSSDYSIEGPRHGTSVYVRGCAARRGIGSALLRLAECEAVARGGSSIEVEASLAGVAFYAANGFVEVGRGETWLTTGRPIACVFMRKQLPAACYDSPTSIVLP